LFAFPRSVFPWAKGLGATTVAMQHIMTSLLKSKLLFKGAGKEPVRATRACMYPSLASC
jgi:hypothetical protein